MAEHRGPNRWTDLDFATTMDGRRLSVTTVGGLLCPTRREVNERQDDY